MSQLNEEKYISIEYDTWQSKYLPLERENEILKRKLHESKIKVRVDLCFEREKYHPVGYLEIHTQVPADLLSNFFEPRIDPLIVGFQEQIKNAIERNDNMRSMVYGNKYFTKEEAQSINQTCEYHAKNAETFRNEVKEEFLRLKRLPKIVKWLLKIKF